MPRRWPLLRRSSAQPDFVPRAAPSYGLAEHVLAATLGVRGREPRVDVVASDALSERCGIAVGF